MTSKALLSSALLCSILVLLLPAPHACESTALGPASAPRGLPLHTVGRLAEGFIQNDSQILTTDSQLTHPCCVRYTNQPLPFDLIRGFTLQRSREVCRLNAVIFLTKGNRKVCATIEDEWVRKALAKLSSKIAPMLKKYQTTGSGPTPGDQ